MTSDKLNINFSFMIYVNNCRKPSVIAWLFALSFEISRGSSYHRVHGLFERALASDSTRNSVILWRCYISYEMNVACDPSAARRVYFRAIHACPWYVVDVSFLYYEIK